MNLGQVWEKFENYLENRVLAPPTGPDELAADFADFVRQEYSRPKRRRKRTTQPSPIRADLPQELERRQREWVDAQLRRTEETVAITREVLGFDGTPYPGDKKLADAFISWAIQTTDAPAHSPRFGRMYPSIDSLRNKRLKSALIKLNPPVHMRSKRHTQTESQLLAYWSAIERLVSECERLTVSLGANMQAAARWILAGIKPESACIEARLTEQIGGPDTIMMKINANVVTAEELRTIYRQLARIVNRPIDNKIRRFFTPLEGNQSRTVAERRSLWNDLYPLHRYGSDETFRVVTSRALKATGRKPSGSPNAEAT